MAQDFGADTRAIMASSQFKQIFPAFALRRGGNAKDNIQTIKGGRAVFVGRGGALTGRGAHLLLGDDLFKDHEEARSQAIRDQAWNWFTKVAMTRRMGKKLVVLTMTRWHSDDVIGRLTDPENPNYNAIEAKKWKIIRLPAIAEDDDPLGRKPGEALWPERYDLDFLESQQRLDPLGFSALYQQSPTVADGVLFRRESFQYYRMNELPTDLRYYCASDFALGTGQRHDSTVHIKIGIDKQDNIYIVDCYWRKVASDVSVEAMLEMGRGPTAPLIWWAEKGHISKSIGPFLHKRMLETRTHLNIREVTPSGDKEQRAQSIAARIAMGKVYFPRDAIWTERAINELLAFPNGTHDDFVDTIAYIGLGLRSQFAPKAAQNVQSEPKFGTLAWVKLQAKWAEQQLASTQAGGF
jgi:predicted phage terminase large subunit-like protein